ncbi:hypothetical protein ACFWWM_16280 [Streptomyces sp. NPDC058682]|uniref:hypothetical protein n=1 Tax=unclassified Streptomyces TaxID=2593676 RepID=UPI00225AC32B|nr:hypothetical protein [Streptomyces sp. NBC_01214]MCX4804533.1 hypothetical protein [Streptomyces sp. NBC_01214]
MTTLEHLLSRALLTPNRAVPRDIVPIRETSSRNHPVAIEAPKTSAAEELRALCEALVHHTPATTVAGFVTEQVPEPRSALILACVLQLTDTDDGARFWWQYAAGAGHPAAAYCLYLHHLSLGETHTARWWRTQTDQTHTDTAKPDAPTVHTTIRCDGDPFVLHHDDGASSTTLLRVMRGLAGHVSRPRSAVVAELMTYMPTAVAVGYLREPESELPLPGPDFAHKVRTLLAAAANRPDGPSDLPARPTLRRDTTRTTRRARRQIDEAATH